MRLFLSAAGLAELVAEPLCVYGSTVSTFARPQSELVGQARVPERQVRRDEHLYVIVRERDAWDGSRCVCRVRLLSC